MNRLPANDFEAALAQHRAGDWTGAETVYRRLLSEDPDRVEVRHSLGLLHFQRGEYARAETELSGALALAPENAALHNHLGATLVQMHQLDRALAILTRATELDPASGEIWFNLGCALRSAEQSEPAREAFERAVELSPGFVAAWYNLANELREQQRLDEAIAAFRHALQLQPDHAKSARNLAITLARLAETRREAGLPAAALDALEEAVRLDPGSPEMRVRLGLALQALERHAEAETRYREALDLRPDYPEALGNLAGALSARNLHEEALQACDAALAARPDFPEALVNRGNALWSTGHREEALQDYERAIALAPGYAEGHYNLGKALSELRRVPEAERHFEEVLRREPDHAGAHFALGLDALRAGDFERGWEGYEWRWQLKTFGHLSPRGLWDGSDPVGKTILMRCEQGLGDFIHFVRYAADLRRLGAAVVVECPRPLLPLMQGYRGIDRLVPRGEAPGSFDAYAPMASLPRLLRTRLETIPAEIPYLEPAAELLDRWKQRLGDRSKFRIGVAWEGNPDYLKNRERSFPLSALTGIAGLPGVELISLLPGKGQGEVTVLGEDFDTESGPFMDTAAVMLCLDLVIACDSALAHLAGALGVPTWLALDTAPDWRWMEEREDSPWYPHHRIFRQTHPGDWTEVFERMRHRLERELPSRLPAKSPTLTVEISPGELFDKITILELKNERITEPAKLANVRLALDELTATRDEKIPAPEKLDALVSELRHVNGVIWDVEDELRECERRGDFGGRFVELARSVYQNNDRRAALKREIDESLGSRLLEEKSYTAYQTATGS
jgi:tetratricopeptide (TPR) repeat protein